MLLQSPLSRYYVHVVEERDPRVEPHGSPSRSIVRDAGAKPCPIPLTTTSRPKMNGKPVARGAVAGGLLLACMLLGAAIGWGLGSLLGAVALLVIAGVFAGLVGGFALVYARFRDL
jgi:hypothetical protein